MTVAGPGYEPPSVLAWLARVLLPGKDGAFVRADMADGYADDRAAGLSRSRAAWRYALNLIGSLWSLWGAILRRTFMRGMLLDAKLGMRMLVKQPVLTGVAMLSLGLGIPSSLLMQHALDVVLRPLPIPEGERVMGVRYRDLETRRDVAATVHDYELWSSSLESFDALAAVLPRSINLRTDSSGDPPVQGAEATASFFDVLGGQPLLGRMLNQGDQAPGAPDVLVISEDLWHARFARDPDILGRVLPVGARDHMVVGVMPAQFRYPIDEDAWLPLKIRPTDHDLGEGPSLLVFGRLAEGIEEADADAEVEVMTARLAREHPDLYEQRVGQVVSMPVLLLGEGEGIRNDPEVLLTQTLLMAMLLIVCGNVGVLVLARTATRTSEMSVRTALGASRSRIVIQIFVEALVLALVATGLGLSLGEGIARWLMGAVAAVPMSGIPFWMDMTLTTEIILLAFALAVGCAVFAGVVPALKATRKGVQSNLQRAATGSTMRFGWGSSLLIVSEVVLAVGFLAMGGTLVRSAFQKTEGLLGLDPDRFLYAEVLLPSALEGRSSVQPPPEDAREALASLQDEVLRGLDALPDVQRVGMGRQMPGRSTPTGQVVLEGQELSERRVRVAQVDVGFFRQFSHPILQGRDFTSADLGEDPADHRPSVIVNTRFVDEVLGGRNPIGLRFHYRSFLDEGEEPLWYEVVGVVGPLAMNAFNPQRDEGVYHPIAAGEINPMRYLVEAEGDPQVLAPVLRDLVARLDPEASVPRALPLQDMIRSESRILRWIFLGQVVLAGVAFLLSVTGLYALMSFTVSQRRREIGVRAALGARPWSIVKTIARRAALQLALGLGLGGVWAWVLLGQIADDSMTMPTNVPVTILVTLVGAGLVGAAACAEPTIRGLRIQPVEAMSDH